MLDFSRIKTYPIARRRNLVHLSDLIAPDAPPPTFEDPDFAAVVDHIIAARRAGRSLIWMMGAHVIKSGLSRLLIDMLKRHIITHVAGNGAVSIHDFELALIGETSEDVASSLEDGTFGMAEETGALMHQALRDGARDGLGYGAAIGRFMAQHPELFPHREVSVLYQAYVLGMPATVHVTLGADIIHQHPAADFAVLGATSGADFRRFATAVSQLAGGVFVNFGSAVTGPEVFLKALTVARNLGHRVAPITTANFDLLPVDDAYRARGYEDPLYYYRPLKNIVRRPTSLGGQGYHVTGDHRETIPALYHRVTTALELSNAVETPVPAEETLPPEVQALVQRQPVLKPVVPDLLRAFRELRRCFLSGGTLFICGNGGSMADALHMSGELLKSYAQPRALPPHVRDRLLAQEQGALLARNLEPGLRTVVLGLNPSLSSAVANDMPDRNVNYAQELLALARPGDVLLGLSTSGNAQNVAYAVQTARALGLAVIGFTGAAGGRLAHMADVAICVPATRTDRVQELHIYCYHTLCEMLEAEFFER